MPEPATNKTPLVGVIVPTIGRWDLLDLTLTAIENQTGVHTRAVVVNDSGEVAPQWLEERCLVVTTSGRTGEGNARAVGLSEITEEWVAFCDDDDLWLPQKLGRQIEALRDQPGWCVCGADLVDADLKQVGRRPADRVERLVRSGQLLQDLLCHNPIPAGSSTVLVSTELLRAVGGWDTNLEFFADWECWIRLAARMDPAVVCEDLTLYRQWEGQMVADRSKAWNALDHIRLRHQHLRSQFGVSPLDDIVIIWILVGELRTPGRRVDGLRHAAKRVRPTKWTDLGAVWRLAQRVGQELPRRLRRSSEPQPPLS